MSVVEQLEAAGEVLSPAVRAVLLAQETRIATLETRVRELEARLRQNSANSSQPPSADPPGATRGAAPPSGRGRGGQPGHPGHHRALVAPARVDVVVAHRPRRAGAAATP